MKRTERVITMSLLVTGSIGIDTVTTPFGKAEGVLGGSAVHFALAASQHVPVRLVAVVGEDFPPEYMDLLRSKPIDLTGLEVRRGSKTFRWTAKFEGAMNEAETLDVALNVLMEDPPSVPEAFLDSRMVFLANTHPELQKNLLLRLRSPDVSVCDTMNLWIQTAREALWDVLSRVTGVILNDAEARDLTGRINLIDAGECLLSRGPKFALIKKGENGSLLVTREGAAALPAYPTKNVCDPTGAGDSFAGGIMGYLAARGRADLETLKRAMAYGTVAASFTIEGFSVNGAKALTREAIERRVEEYVAMLRIP